MRAVISGAGIAGLTAAARLHHHGWDVTVVDVAPGPREQGYMMDFFGPGFQAVTSMGLLPRLREAAGPVDTLRYVDARGRTTVAVPYSRFTRALDGKIVSIMRPALERLLRETLPDGVDVRHATTIEAVDDGDVTLSDGTALSVDLVVGADGIHSGVRSLVLGPEPGFLRPLGLHTAAYVVTDAGLARQVRREFLLTESLGRQLGLYGIGDDQIAVFAVHRTPELGLPADTRHTLRTRYAGLGELADQALARCPSSDRIYYDLVTQIETPRWHTGRVVLVGDAAHAVSLVAGQGASLGVAGAFVLAEELGAARTVTDGLESYERRWRPVVSGVQATARERAADWFVPDTTAKLLLRRWGFHAMGLPGVDRLVVRRLLPKDHGGAAELLG